MTEDKLADEKWKSIPEFHGYEASTLGRIRKLNGRLLKPTLSQKGYFCIFLRKNKHPSIRKRKRLKL